MSAQARQTTAAEDAGAVTEPRVSIWREVLSLLWAIFWGAFVLVALYQSMPFLAMVAGGGMR